MNKLAHKYVAMNPLKIQDHVLSIRQLSRQTIIGYNESRIENVHDVETVSVSRLRQKYSSLGIGGFARKQM